MFDDLSNTEAEILEEALAAKMDLYWDMNDHEMLEITEDLHDRVMDEYDRPNHS